MALVSDFTVIQGNADHLVGDPATLWEQNFNVWGYKEGSQAMLIFMVKGLTYATEGVDVKINNKVVGQIFPYRWPTKEMRNAAASHYYTQIINIGGDALTPGKNELQIEAIGFPEESGSNKFDNFEIRDLMCFFQQAV